MKVVDTQEEADQEEIYWISEMRRIYGEDKIYNIAEGGMCGNAGTKKSEEIKQKLSIAHKGQHSSPNTEFKKGHITHNKGKVKFNFIQRQEIRDSKLSYNVLAKKYNTCISMIHRIKKYIEPYGL